MGAQIEQLRQKGVVPHNATDMDVRMCVYGGLGLLGPAGSEPDGVLGGHRHNMRRWACSAVTGDGSREEPGQGVRGGALWVPPRWVVATASIGKRISL